MRRATPAERAPGAHRSACPRNPPQRSPLSDPHQARALVSRHARAAQNSGRGVHVLPGHRAQCRGSLRAAMTEEERGNERTGGGSLRRLLRRLDHRLLLRAPMLWRTRPLLLLLQLALLLLTLLPFAQTRIEHVWQIYGSGVRSWWGVFVALAGVAILIWVR